MKEILKQSSWLFTAQLLTRIISFFYTIYLARILGVSEFGLLTVALAYFSIISSVSDLGFNRFLIREIARGKIKIQELIWNIAMLRLTLTSVLFAVFSIFLYILDPDKMRVSLILLATLAILPQSIALTFDAVFVGLRKLQFSAISLLLSGLATVAIGIFLVSRGLGPTGAINAIIFGQLVYVLVLFFFFLKHEGVTLQSIKLPILKQTITGSLPYGLLGIMGLLYFKVDAIILSYFRGSFETGIYGAAYRFLEAATFIPYAFFASLFPVLAKAHDLSPASVKQLYFKSLKIMALLGFILAAAYFFILPQVIYIFLPDYLLSVGAIKILAFSIPFMFLHTPAVAVLFSTDKYLKKVLLFSAVILGFNIVVNLIFIPRYGFLAASWITVISEALSFIVFFLFTQFQILQRKHQ
ncbi:flippase [Candidatus Daviesbacteria bacterium]|nr:flippase [Candidatus Daviesbacteria bacterium]